MPTVRRRTRRPRIPKSDCVARSHPPNTMFEPANAYAGRGRFSGFTGPPAGNKGLARSRAELDSDGRPDPARKTLGRRPIDDRHFESAAASYKRDERPRFGLARKFGRIGSRYSPAIARPFTRSQLRRPYMLK